MQPSLADRFKKIKPKYLIAGIVFFLLLLGMGVGLFLSSQSQDVRQQASTGGVYPVCAGGVQSGQRACDGFRTYVTCGTNGLFGPSTACSANQVCQGGNCVAEGGGGGGYCDRSAPNTNDCTDVNAGSSCRTTSGASGTCRILVSGGANTECNCVAGGGGGTPSASPVASVPPGQCVGAGASCSIGGSGASTCCSGLVCQNGLTGQLRCEDPGTSNVCPGNGVCGGSGGWLGFRCNQLTNGQCLENPGTFNSFGEAAAYASSCGQVDEVCVGGTNNRNLCGSFQIFSSGCGSNPTAPPTVPPTTPPTVPPTVPPSVQPSVTPSVQPSVTPSVQPSVSPSPSPTPIVCGSACSFTSQCPQDHTCNSGRCELTSCVNGAACSSDRCRVTACGSTCSSNSECPNDHTCSGNRCVLNACANGSSCSSDRCRVTGCTSTCSSNSECPNDHTCSNGVCRLTQCVNGASCDSNQCNVVTNPTPTATPAVGCNDPCVNNSDCRSNSHICVDTVNGRRCRYEQNITSDSCSGAPVVAQSTPQPQAPAVLPTAGSNDIIMAVGAGAAAIVLGIVGFLML
jgi:hypothetical protein